MTVTTPFPPVPHSHSSPLTPHPSHLTHPHTSHTHSPLLVALNLTHASTPLGSATVTTPFPLPHTLTPHPSPLTHPQTSHLTPYTSHSHLTHPHISHTLTHPYTPHTLTIISGPQFDPHVDSIRRCNTTPFPLLTTHPSHPHTITHSHLTPSHLTHPHPSHPHTLTPHNLTPHTSHTPLLVALNLTHASTPLGSATVTTPFPLPHTLTPHPSLLTPTHPHPSHTLTPHTSHTLTIISGPQFDTRVDSIG